MRIGRLFAVSMFSVSALAVILGAEVVVPQGAHGREAIKAVEAFSAVLTIGQHVAGFRAPYITPLFQDAAATPAQLEATKAAIGCGDVPIEQLTNSQLSAIAAGGLRDRNMMPKALLPPHKFSQG